MDALAILALATQCATAAPAPVVAAVAMAETSGSTYAVTVDGSDIVVTPNNPSAAMKRYVARLMRREAGAVEVIYPNFAKDDMQPLGTAELLDPVLIGKLKAAMASGGGEWDIRPYYHDRTIARLAKHLSLENSPWMRSTPFLREGGAEILNDKATFRNLAAGRGVSLASGEVCKTESELFEAVETLCLETGAAILKQNRHSGAEGNIIITFRDDTATQGALRHIRVNDHEGLKAEISSLWGGIHASTEAAVVVEAYYPVRSILYAEFDVNAASHAVRFLNWGEQRMEPIFMGFVIPPDLAMYSAASFITGATELARITCDLGFSGLMDVDGIVTDTGRVIFNEVNARSGGCSHIHHIATALLGEGYGDHFVIRSHNRIRPGNVEVVHAILDDPAYPLGFSFEKNSGVIITSEDLAISGMLEFLTIGRSREEAAALEKEFEQALSSTINEQMRLTA